MLAKTVEKFCSYVRNYEASSSEAILTSNDEAISKHDCQPLENCKS